MKIFQTIKSFILEPISQIKARYIPLLLIYAAYAASSITGIAESFYVKKSLTLTAQDLILLGAYATIPWTLKFIFGQFCDTIKFFGSQRKSYIIFGSILMFASYVMLAAIAGDYAWALNLASKNTLYIISSIVLSASFCIQNVVSETMSTEVVDRFDKDSNPLDKEIINKELTLIQYLSKLSFAFSGFIVAGLSGYLASVMTYSHVFLCGCIIPVIVLFGISFVHLDQTPPQKPNWKILGSGLAFAVFCILMGTANLVYSQEIIFVVSIAIVCSLLYIVCKDLDPAAKKTIMLSSFIIFCYQGTPSSGPGINWWMQDKLGFDEMFYGTLGQIGAALSLVGMWVLGKWIKNKQVAYILLFLTILQFILSLPTVGLAYGLQDWTQSHFGFGAKTITLLDVALASPFEMITSVTLMALVASHAPRGKAGTFFALMTSLMNLSLNFSALMTKYLYKIYPIERGMYENVKAVLVSSTTISLIVPTIVIMIFMNPFRKQKEVILVN